MLKDCPDPAGAGPGRSDSHIHRPRTRGEDLPDAFACLVPDDRLVVLSAQWTRDLPRALIAARPREQVRGPGDPCAVSARSWSAR